MAGLLSGGAQCCRMIPSFFWLRELSGWPSCCLCLCGLFYASARASDYESSPTRGVARNDFLPKGCGNLKHVTKCLSLSVSLFRPQVQQGGHISPVPSAHTQLMSYKLQGGGDFVGGGAANNGGANGGLLGLGLQHGPGSNSSSRSSISSNSSMHSNGNVNGGGGGGNGLIGPGGTLGIVSGDYIDLNELLNMDGHCGGNDEEHSLVA